MITLMAFVIVITVLVFVHELGHYLAARSVGVRVERFSILLPPRLVSLTSVPNGWEFRLFFFGRDESGRLIWKPVYQCFFRKTGRKGSLTEYTLALIPFGGYVKMSGMIDESLDTNINHEPYELMSKSKWAQAWVMGAGVIMNIVLAFVLFTWITGVTGIPEVRNEPVVGSLLDGLPAQAIGLEPGDRLLAIDGHTVTTWDEMTGMIRPLPNREISLRWEHQGTVIEKPVMIGVDPTRGGDAPVGMLGIAPEWSFRPASVGETLKAGAISTINGFGLIFLSIKMIADGSASIRDIGGPIAIAQYAGDAAQLGWVYLVQFMALISVNLAFINILPIPGLDGGHILIAIIEGIRRRSLTIRTRMVIQQIGMALLMVLILTIMYNDIWKLIFTN
ncbi:MAG: RIP metalloprotease RseP [Candidatus Neomarinimicrobiota bacterium]